MELGLIMKHLDSFLWFVICHQFGVSKDCTDPRVKWTDDVSSQLQKIFCFSHCKYLDFKVVYPEFLSAVWICVTVKRQLFLIKGSLRLMFDKCHWTLVRVCCHRELVSTTGVVWTQHQCPLVASPKHGAECGGLSCRCCLQYTGTTPASPPLTLHHCQLLVSHQQSYRLADNNN